MHCLVQPDRLLKACQRLPLLPLRAQSPGGAQAPRATAAGRAGTPFSPVTYLPQWGRRDSRCPRPQGSRGAGRGWRPGAPGCRAEENPGARAQATESQAHSRSGAPGDGRAQKPSAGAERGLELWLLPLGLEPEAGTRGGAGLTHGAHARAHVATPGGHHLPAAAALSSGSPAC